MLKKIIIFLLVVIFIIFNILGVAYYLYRSGRLSKMILNKIDVQKEQDGGAKVNLIQKFLGFEKKQTYLLLFLNNTELRPGGGFIGTYAVVEMDRGVPNVVKVEGTEILDNSAPDFTAAPPDPLKKYLKVERWNFRDSNWSPDFAASSLKSLELYKMEKGERAEEVSAVIGFTPTVIEEMLKISGPIKVNGEEFNYKNFTEKLEYEVEYGFADRGLNFSERKRMLKDITYALAKRLGEDVLIHWTDYFNLSERMFKEKQAMAYSLDGEIEKMIFAKNWGGLVKNYPGQDYLLWVDANLGALKTDFSIRRSLSYSFSPDKNGRYVAEAKMKYVHVGKFDWRTTRYLSYVRIFVPADAELLDVKERLYGVVKTKKDVDSGEELSKKWFGNFISIEPGQTKELIFRYYLSSAAAGEIKKGRYELLAQKQLGSRGALFDLNLKFNRRVVAASPGELETDWGNNSYNLKTDLTEDRDFSIRLAE